MSYLSEYMAQDEATQKLINTLPSDEHIRITVNGRVVDLGSFVETHCNHMIEEASITFASGLILGYGPKHHNRGWSWGISLLPAAKVDYSHISEITNVLHIFIAKVKALREFVRWTEVHKGWIPKNCKATVVGIPLEHQKDAFLIEKDRI